MKRIEFGEGDQKYTMTDPTTEEVGNAIWSAIHKQEVTFKELSLLTSIVIDYRYLCEPTNINLKDVCGKLSELRRYIKNKRVEKSSNAEVIMGYIEEELNNANL